MAIKSNTTNPAAVEALRKCSIRELICINDALRRIFDITNAANNEPRCRDHAAEFINQFIDWPLYGFQLATIAELEGRTAADKFDAILQRDVLVKHHIDSERFTEAMKLLAELVDIQRGKAA
jgi:hypothetical protein